MKGRHLATILLPMVLLVSGTVTLLIRLDQEQNTSNILVNAGKSNNSHAFEVRTASLITNLISYFCFLSSGLSRSISNLVIGS